MRVADVKGGCEELVYVLLFMRMYILEEGDVILSLSALRMGLVWSTLPSRVHRFCHLRNLISRNVATRKMP